MESCRGCEDWLLFLYLKKLKTGFLQSTETKLVRGTKLPIFAKQEDCVWLEEKAERDSPVSVLRNGMVSSSVWLRRTHHHHRSVFGSRQ